MSHPLWRVNRKRFKYIKLREESALEDLCTTNEVDFDNRCMFLELRSVDFVKKTGDKDVINDVILIDKVLISNNHYGLICSYSHISWL